MTWTIYFGLTSDKRNPDIWCVWPACYVGSFTDQITIEGTISSFKLQLTCRRQLTDTYHVVYIRAKPMTLVTPSRKGWWINTKGESFPTLASVAEADGHELWVTTYPPALHIGMTWIILRLRATGQAKPKGMMNQHQRWIISHVGISRRGRWTRTPSDYVSTGLTERVN